ncbi:MAG: hypothetical protein OCC49_15810 [Fibrobacterales bacterium]
MQLTTVQLEGLQGDAVTAAKAAGAIIKKRVHEQFVVRTKSGGDTVASQIVTEVDDECQKIILEYLAESISRYDLGLLAEESTDDESRLIKDYFWCVDPLDGTLPFTENIPGYAVSIALVSKIGEPIIGVVYDPARSILYEAIAGKGAFKNGNPFVISAVENDGVQNPSFTFISDRSFVNHPRCLGIKEQLMKYSSEEERTAWSVIDTYGAVVNGCLVMEHSSACYIKLPKEAEGGGSIWDFAATACIIVEAGGVVTDIKGEVLPLNDQRSTFMNRFGVMYASSSEVARATLRIVG